MFQWLNSNKDWLLVLFAEAAICAIYLFVFNRSTKTWRRFPFYWRQLRLPADASSESQRHNLQKQWKRRHDELIKYCQASGGVFIGVTAAILYFLMHQQWNRSKPEFTTPVTLILLFWMVIIPVYLFVEYATFCDKISKEDAEHLRHFQDLTHRVWVALLIVFASICFGRFFVASN